MSIGAPDGSQWQSPIRYRNVGGSKHYTADLVLPANTLSSAPVTLTIATVKGWIARIKLLFPPGPAALAHVVIKDKNGQLYPTTSTQDYHIDNDKIELSCDLDTVPDPVDYNVYFVGWNDDDTWEHTITCDLWVIPY